MIKPAIILLLFLLSQSFSKAQPVDWFKYTTPQDIPSKYKVDIQSEYEYNLKIGLPSFSEEEKKDFAQTMAYSKYVSISGGSIYYNLDEIEAYLNQVMYKILPETLRKENRMRIYLKRDPSFNAFAIHDGTFFFNIGALADMKDEAQIAFLIGHEISHYILKHSQLGYANELKAETFWGRSMIWGRSIKLKNLDYSRQQEHDADSLGIILTNAAGYDAKAELEITSILGEIEGEPTKKSARLEKYSTHPRSSERYKREQNIINKLATKGQKRFIIQNEQYFSTILQKCKQERLNLLLAKNDLDLLLMEGLEMHFEDKNTYSAYLVAEAIRRKIYMEPKLAKKPFPFTSDGNKKIDVSEKKNLEGYFIGNVSYNETEFFSNKIDTYSDAFLLFANKSNNAGNPEALLSIALYYHPNKNDRDKYLNDYLKTIDGKQKEYAKALKEGTLEGSSQNAIVIVNPIRYTKIVKKLRADDYVKYNMAEAAASLEEKTQGFLDKKGMNRKVFLYANPKTERLPILSKSFDIADVMDQFGEEDIIRSRLSILDPSIWQFYKANDIQSIEFQSFNFTEKPNAKYRNLLWFPPTTFIYAVYQFYHFVFSGGRRDRGLKLETDYTSINMSERYANVYSLDRVTSKRLTASNIARYTKKLAKESDSIKKDRSAKLKKEKKRD